MTVMGLKVMGFTLLIAAIVVAIVNIKLGSPLVLGVAVVALGVGAMVCIMKVVRRQEEC